MTTCAYLDMLVQLLCMPADRCLVLDTLPSLAAHEACSICHNLNDPSHLPDQTLRVLHKSAENLLSMAALVWMSKEELMPCMGCKGPDRRCFRGVQITSQQALSGHNKLCCHLCSMYEVLHLVQHLIQRIRRRHVYLYRATNIQKQPSTIAAVVPQNPIILSSSVDFKFIPNIPAIIAPIPAAKPAMDSVSSSRFTCRPPDAAYVNSSRQNSIQGMACRRMESQTLAFCATN